MAEMKSVNRQRILILTLGTGDIISYNKDEKRLDKPKDIEERARRIEAGFDNEDGYFYINTNYLMEGVDSDGGKRDEIIRSQYIAEPLCRKFQPDIIYVIGTVKSNWVGFYRKFCNLSENKEAHINRMRELDKNSILYGISTNGEELKEVQGRMNEIFSKVPVPGVPDKRFRLVLTQYGVDEEQLKKNYSILSEMLDELNHEVAYEVAFDITHSFRSMPLYNYIILNYFRQIRKLDIEVSHIYYGNVEVVRETGEYFKERIEGAIKEESSLFTTVAPVVDLKNIVNVLELTEGVSEFKNTGSTKRLTENLRKNGLVDLEKVLSEFDLATQLNDFDRIYDSLRSLRKVLSGKSGHKGDYEDLKEMLRRVIDESFPEEGYLSGEKVYEDTPSSVLRQCRDLSYLQFLISKWHMGQRKYGLAIATGIEALRSYLSVYYLGDDLSLKMFKDRDDREDAEVKLTDFLKDNAGFLSKDNDMEELLAKIILMKKEAKDARNIFAHNLMGKENEELDKKKVENPKKIIRDFSECLELFVMEEKKENPSLLKILNKIYEQIRLKDGEEEAKLEIKERMKKNRILVSHKQKEVKKYERIIFENKKNSYKVYSLHRNIVKILKNGKTFDEVVGAAILLSDYIKKLEREEDFSFQSVVFDAEVQGLTRSIYQMVLERESAIEEFYWYNDGRLDKLGKERITYPYKEIEKMQNHEEIIEQSGAFVMNPKHLEEKEE